MAAKKNAVSCAEYQLRKARGEVEPRVPVQETRDLLRRMNFGSSSHGRFSYRFIGEQIGVSPETLAYIGGKRGKQQKVVRESTAVAVRNLYDKWIYETQRHNREGMAYYPDARQTGLVNVYLVRRAVQGLVAQGFSQTEIGRGAGLGRWCVQRILNPRVKFVSVDNEKKILDLTRRLGSSQGTGPGRNKSLRLAEENGWRPTMYEDRLV